MRGGYGWMLIGRAVLALALGGIAVFAPLTTLAAVLLVVAVYAIVDGALALAAAILGRIPTAWGLLHATLGVGCGFVILTHPALSAATLVAIVGAWAIVVGAVELSVGLRLRRRVGGAAWLALAGAVSIAFGVLLVAHPIAGAVALAWAVGIYALACGAALLPLGVAVLARLRRSAPDFAIVR